MTTHLTMSAAVGRRLRDLRIAAGVPLDRLALQVGMEREVLFAIEEGSQRRPPIEMLDRVARRLKVSIVELVRAAKTEQPSLEVPPPGGVHLESAGIDDIARAVAALPRHVGDKLEAVELAVVKHAMATSGNNRSAAARLLGIDRKALIRRWDKMKRASKKRGRAR
jgi:transcriptional regulator with XRE-family HTH domain